MPQTVQPRTPLFFHTPHFQGWYQWSATMGPAVEESKSMCCVTLMPLVVKYVFKGLPDLVGQLSNPQPG